MTHGLSRRLLIGSLLGGVAVLVAGCDLTAFFGNSEEVRGEAVRRQLEGQRIFEIGAIANAIARLTEQAAAPGTSNDLRDRMNALITRLDTHSRLLESGSVYDYQSSQTNTLLGEAADLMIEAGNLRIRELYGPFGRGAYPWISAWWDYSSP